MELKRKPFQCHISLSLLFVWLKLNSFADCDRCFFPQKFHSQEVGKALVRVCMFQLLEFQYFYGVSRQSYPSQAIYGKMVYILFIIFNPSALSGIWFILLLRFGLWKIQNNGQYLHCNSIKTFITILFLSMFMKDKQEH